MTLNIQIPEAEISRFCQRWQIIELAFFGSVTRDDFQPDSDVDVLVRFHQKSRHTLLDLVRIQRELSLLIGRKIDLVDRTALEQSRNYIRRKAILQSAEVIFAA